MLRLEDRQQTQHNRETQPSAQLDQVAPDHASEWLASAVDPGIIALNVETLTDTATDPNADRLYPIAERLNWTVTRFGQKTRPALRGWWVSGIDPFTRERMSWGRFKPDASTPIFDRTKGKAAKYLSPALGPGSSRLVLLDIPFHIWKRVANRYNVPIASTDRPQGFWQWVWKNNIPIILTEGEKKAGCLLTLGYAAIALPGIFNGYRKETHQLIAELEFFATDHRPVFICFDYETKPDVVKNVNLAITKLGTLLTRAGCPTNVISLPGPQKGVDDFVMAQTDAAFDRLYETAVALDYWQASRLWSLTYPAALTLNQRYLGTLPFPYAGLVCVRSAKGTGKTAALEPLIAEAIQDGRRVLVLTHRIQLGRAICDRLGLDWIEEVRDSETQGMFGFGLCVDSLHSNSQARFNPQAWQGAILILDECEQMIWHALNSSTCYEHRIKILETLRELVQVILSSKGLIIAQDADLSDISVDYLKGLLEQPVDPWVVINEWQPETGWHVCLYDTPNPSALLVQMEQVIQTGPIFVAVDSQKVKGKWSSKNLESYLQLKFPDKRILRIDSESVADPEHPAYGIVEQLNHAVTQYDIVLATPTIGTGVSIDVSGYFKAVFGIFQGAIPDAEARQALARVRDPVPRYVWAALFGPGKIGNGCCSYQDVITSTKKAVKYNIALLKDIDFDLDAQTDPIMLRTWAKMAARVNVSLWRYREEMKKGLLLEGHQITIATADLSQILPPDIQALCTDLAELFGQETIAQELHSDLIRGVIQFPGFEFLSWRHGPELIELATMGITAVRDQNRQAEALAVSNAPTITPEAYASLKDQRAKTKVERYTERKYELEQRYPIHVTPEIKLNDDAGWYTKLRLHYYLIHDPAIVQLRDSKEWQGHLNRGEGKIALQDIRLLTAQVEALRGLGVPALLNPEREVRATDPDVQQLAQYCQQCHQDIKTLFNLTVSEKMKPIEIVQGLLGKIGVKLACIGRDCTDDGRRAGARVYQYQPPQDDRHVIFAQWQQRDQLNQDQPNLATSSQKLGVNGTSDPPPDISLSNPSLAGSHSMSPVFPAVAMTDETALAATSSDQRICSQTVIASIGIGSIVQVAKQQLLWVVTAIDATLVRLQQMGGFLECIAPRTALIAINQGI